MVLIPHASNIDLTGSNILAFRPFHWRRQAMTISLTPPCRLSRERELDRWICDLTDRFPKWIDARLRQGLYSLLGMGISSSFLEKRTVPHLKRLLIVQFLFQ